MKTQKIMKILSVFMTVIMLLNAAEFFTFGTSAAAPTSYTDISVGQSKSVSIYSSGASKYFRFVPLTSGVYTFYSSGSADSYGYLLDASGNELIRDDDSGDSLNFSFAYNLIAGRTYYLRAAMYNTKTGSYYVNIIRGTSDALTLNVSKSVSLSAGGYKDIAFIPETTGNYTFSSSGSLDTYGYLLDSSKYQLISNDDGGSNYNFSFSYDLIAGKTYYLRVKFYSSSTSGSFSVKVVCNTVVEYLALNQSKSVTISTAGGQREYAFIPDVSGKYNFSSSGSFDTYGYLLDSSKTQLTSNDDGGSGLNFSITYDLIAGRTYYLRTKFYSNSTTGTFTVKVIANTLVEPIDPILPTNPNTDVWDGTIASGFGGGSGTQDNPYLINTASQLAYLAKRTNEGTNYSGKYFKLTVDIDLNNRNWTPIGIGVLTGDTYTTTKAFRGNFNGDYHTVYNLYIADTLTTFTGFFGCLYGANISKLGIVNASINGYGCGTSRCTAGILAGASSNNTYVSKCFVRGNINISAGSSFVDIASLIGDHYNTTVTDAYAVTNIRTTTSNGGHTGGLFGYSDGYTSTSRCFYYGNISASGGYTAGGINSNYSEFCGYYYNCYYVSNLSDTVGTSVSQAQLAVQSTFSNYDFESVWEMGSEHPVLRGFRGAGDGEPPHDHDYNQLVIDPTCQSEGFTMFFCNCGHSYDDLYIPRLPHVPGEWIIDVPVTCTSAGSKHTECTVCGEMLENVYIPTPGHSYTTEVTKEVTCTEPGITTHTCTICGDSYLTYIYSEHSYSITETKAPTCKTDGFTTYTCANCGDSYDEIIPGSHDYVAEVTKVATPEQNGEITYRCTICNNSYVEVIPARPDARVLLIQDRFPWTENNNVALLDKMVDDGYLAGWDITTTSDFDAADLANYGVVLIANDQTTATYNKLCEIQDALVQFANAGGVVIYGACDHGWAAGDIGYILPENVQKDNFYSQYNYIVDKDHPIVTGVNTDGKSLTNTLLYGNYCSHTAFFDLPANANVILQDGHGDPTLVEYSVGSGHIILSGLTWEFYYVRNAYDSHSNTTYTRNVYDDLVYYALGLSDSCSHAYDEGTVVAPGCTEPGYTLHTCELCNSTMKDNFVPATDHTPGVWMVIRRATATKPGLKAVYCTVCAEKVMEEVIPMIDNTVVTVTAETDTVMVGQTFEVYISVSECDPVKSIAFVPQFDPNVFELVSKEWLIPATIQVTDPEIVSAWTDATDINGNVLKLVLRAVDVAGSTPVSTEAYIQNTDIITLSVVGDNITVIRCTHELFDVSAVDSTYHINVCSVCGYNYLSVHTFDHGCDTECNDCGYTRAVSHMASELLSDDARHWHECILCGEVLDSEDHIYDGLCDTDCNICGEVREGGHVPCDRWEFDESEHWLNCSVCGETLERHSHDFDGEDDSVCDTCTYCRVLRGDIFEDGLLDSDDAIKLLLHVYAPEAYVLNQNGDMDGDGDVDSDDAIRILLYIYFPEEYPLSNH